MTKEDDLPTASSYSEFDVIIGEKGLCAQRNRAIQILQPKYDLIVFLDDDYVPSTSTLQNIEDFFDRHTDIVGITGLVLADGIRDLASRIKMRVRLCLSTTNPEPPLVETIKDVESLYGCNMAMRCEAIGQTRFDEKLPLYGWLEDVDFTNQLLSKGRLVHTNSFAGVHCGVKSARTPGLPLGYSQIANPVYLGRKGTQRWRIALRLMARNVVANHARCLNPEPWVDRPGRVRGNWLAFYHLLRGKLSPEYIEQL